MVDWLLVGLDLAVIVTLRLILLAGAFTIFFATTTPSELRLALEWFRVPYRFAFSLSLAFQSLGLLEDEWRAILEAQRARGAWRPPRLNERPRRLHALFEGATWTGNRGPDTQLGGAGGAGDRIDHKTRVDDDRGRVRPWL